MVQHPWSDFLKNQFTKLVGLSLGVNRMWIKRDDHAPKVDVMMIFIFSMYVQKWQFWKQFKFDCSLVIVCLHSNNKFITTFLCHGPCFFFFWSTSFASPTTKPVGPCKRIMEVLKYAFWRPQIPYSLWHFLLGVNWSRPVTSSIANHKFYRALGWRHGP